jgi:hypothetical protein
MPLLHWAEAQALNPPLPLIFRKRPGAAMVNLVTNHYPSVPDAGMLVMLVRLKLDASTRSAIWTAVSRTKCPASQETFGVPPRRVVSSALELEDHG